MLLSVVAPINPPHPRNLMFASLGKPILAAGGGDIQCYRRLEDGRAPDEPRRAALPVIRWCDNLSALTAS
jgi:hypothetical protein